MIKQLGGLRGTVSPQTGSRDKALVGTGFWDFTVSEVSEKAFPALNFSFCNTDQQTYNAVKSLTPAK